MYRQIPVKELLDQERGVRQEMNRKAFLEERQEKLALAASKR